jgi:Zn-dependent protease/predicted transcriptional regulator
MPASFHLGRVAGIPIGLHYSWLLIAALITFSLAGRFQQTHPGWDTPTVWSVAVLTAVLFFVTLLAHELSHAVVARGRGLPVRSITLFALGGVAHIEKDATTAKTEFLVAIVGPIVSLVIGVACIGVAQSMGWSLDDSSAGLTGSVLGWLGSINIVLAVFNLIPGYPLDGGRVLRALLWAIYNNVERATRNAARVGQVVAGILITWGLLQFFFGAGIGGLWLAFLGWFLMMAAQASYTDVSIGQALKNIRVGDVMANDCVTVNPQVKVQGLVDDVLLRTGRRCVMVKTDGHVVGLVTANEIRSVDRSRWPHLTVAEVMRPLERLQTVDRHTSVSDALRTMASSDVNQLPVLSDGRLEGIVSRAQILQLMQAHAQFERR